MNEQRNTTVAQAAYAAFQRNDLPGLLATLSETIDWQTLGPAALPTGGQRRGKNDVARFFEDVDRTWLFHTFEPRQFLAHGDHVVVEGFYEATAKATGRRVAAEWVHVMVVRDGKIAKFREYTDTASLIDALTIG